ncbi:MAG: 6-bladed beta-propeller [Longimicrobiales bacterium]
MPLIARRSVFTGAWLLFLAGCRPAIPEQPGVVIRDSGGIQIVENSSPLWTAGQGWQVAESLVIGAVDGDEDYLLNGVRGAIRMPDGRIVVANGGGSELRVYDAAGTFLRRVGRKGWGPGEFQRPDHVIRLAGDTIAVWDAGIGPVSFFDDELRYIRRERIDRRQLLELLGSERATEAVTPLPDGSFVLHVTSREEARSLAEGQLFRPPLGYFRFARDLSRVDSLGWYGGLQQMYLNIGGRRVYETVDVSPHARIAAGGNPLLIYAGNGEPYEVHAFAATGRLVRIIRSSLAPLPIPADVSERRRRSAEQGFRPQERLRVRDALPRQTHFPAYREVHADADANLWVSRFGSAMDIFDRSGRWLGTVTIAGRPVEIGRDYILTLRHDTLGVERVVLYDLRR